MSDIRGMTVSQNPVLINRRAALSLTFAAIAAPVLLSGSAVAEPVESPLDDVLPFVRSRTPIAGREVFAHWHFFAISMDNQPSGKDYYAANFMTTKDASGKNREFGSYLRERPLPRAPHDTAAWAVADMERDIRWARDVGIDGFLYNIITIDPREPFWQVLQYMLEAATKVGGAFRIVPSLDATLLADQSAAKVAVALKSIASHPMLLRRDGGGLVLGAFAAEKWPAEKWRELFDELAKSGISIEFMPTYLNVRSATTEHWKLTDAASEWGGNYVDGIDNIQMEAAIVRKAGKRWYSPVWPQDFRPKDGVYGEAANSRLFRDDWKSAIEQRADGVHLITWNDYSESSAIRPSTRIQYAYYDLAAYYLEWFKTDRQPAITRDVLYYFHRTQAASGSALGKSQPKSFSLLWGRHPVNEIELLAFLVTPGELEIEIGGKTHRLDAPAGITSMRAPLGIGRPRFRLKRGDNTEIDLASAFAIVGEAEFQNLLYHGGSSSRAVVVE